MAGMQRFVTYLYYYIGNEKRHNAGFAKIEIRGGQCRLEIHLKGMALQESMPKVYLFSREKNSIHAVEVGVLSVKNGSGECRLLLSGEQIAESPYGISDMKGIWIPINEENMYASQWDDGQMSRESIQIWEPKMRPANDDDAQTFGRGETGMEEGDIKTEIFEPIGVQQAKEGQMMEEKQIFPDSNVSQELQIPSVQATQIIDEETVPKEIYQERTLLESFLRLQKREQIIEVFETGKRQVSGIHIQLSDLRELPKRYWALGNNSFLLHGFFSYQYLLLGKRTEDNREYIFVGVPGSFHSQEQIMASLFGFSEFLPGRFHAHNRNEERKLQEIDNHGQLYRSLQAAQMNRETPEAFGYWCHFIMD